MTQQGNVVLRFNSQGLKYAQELSKNIASDAQAAEQAAASAAKQAASAENEADAQRGRLAKRASKLSAKGRAERTFGGLGAKVSTGEPIEKLTQLMNGSGGNLAGRAVGQMVAGLAGGVLGSLILQVTTPLVTAIRKELDLRFELMRKLEILPFKLELEQMRIDSFKNRLKEDEEFARRINESEIRLSGVQASKRVIRTPGPLDYLGGL